MLLRFPIWSMQQSPSEGRADGRRQCPSLSMPSSIARPGAIDWPLSRLADTCVRGLWLDAPADVLMRRVAAAGETHPMQRQTS